MRSVLILVALCTMLQDALSQSQYASSVIAFSTEWSTTSWSAQQTLGAPNTTGCGDISTAWASASADGQREFLVLGITTPQYVNTINIWETWNPGAVDTIYLRNSGNGSWNVVYTATAAPALPCPRTFTTSFSTTSYLVDAIRIASNSPAVPSWNEIDAVEIANICSTTISYVDPTCNLCNGSATANATGQAPFTYLWTPGNMTTPSVSGLCAGTYIVTVTDANNCTSSDTVTLTSVPPLTTNITSSTILCFGDCDAVATVTPTGGCPPYSYIWSPMAWTTATVTGLCAGTYTVTVSDACGCFTTAVATINQPPPLIVSVSTTPTSSSSACDGSATVNPSGGNAPYTYLWMPGGQTTQSITGLCNGSYTVCVTDANGCSNCQTVVISFNIGAEELSWIQIEIFPQPATETLSILFANPVSDLPVVLYSITGEMMLQDRVTGKQKDWDVSGLSPGIYTLQIIIGEQTLHRRIQIMRQP